MHFCELYTLGLSPNTLDVYDMSDGLVAKPATDPAISLPPVFFQGAYLTSFRLPMSITLTTILSLIYAYL